MMNLKKLKEKITQTAGIHVEGTFNAQRFFDTLAAILSRKYGVSITVKVSGKEDEGLEQEKQVV